MEDDRYIVDWKENLLSAYCDILETSGEFLKSSLDIDLGSIIDGIDRIEHFEEIVGEDRIKENKLIFSPYKNVREAVSEIRGKYYSYFSNEKIEGALLKEMMDEIRILLGKMQRGIGKIQYVTEGIEDVKERMELREFIKSIVYFRKLVHHFNDSFSRVESIEWDAGYSRTHIHVIPKIDSVFRPIMSNMIEVMIQEETDISITVGERSVDVDVDGSLFLNFFAFGKIPDIYVKKMTIDKLEGVEITGDGKKVAISREKGKIKIATSEL